MTKQEAIKKLTNKTFFRSIPENLRGDKDVVFAAVDSLYGSEDAEFFEWSYQLEYISSDLKNDRLFMEQLTYYYGKEILKFVSLELRNNKSFVLSFPFLGSHLQFVSDELKSDAEVVLHCVNHNGLSIEFASESLRDCHAIGLSAVKNNFNAFQYLSHNLRKETEIINAVIEHKDWSFYKASSAIKENPNIAILSLEKR